jgi:gas vesicle protein
MKKPYKNIVKTAALGAGIGYLAGLLTAKQSGKQTRKDIINSSKEAKAKAEATVNDLYDELAKTIKQAEAKIDQGKLSVQHNLSVAAVQAKRVRLQTKEILTAIKNGDADDKNLHDSIENTKAALKNLKSYLNK